MQAACSDGVYAQAPAVADSAGLDCVAAPDGFEGSSLEGFSAGVKLNMDLSSLLEAGAANLGSSRKGRKIDCMHMHQR